MSEGLQLGLNLMVIGMVTVFVILFLVVAGGKILIGVVNRYVPDAPTKVIKRDVRATDNEIMAVIVAAVNVITGGKGRVDKINKID